MIFTYQTVLAGIVPREFSLPDGANVWFGAGGPVEQNFNFARLADDVAIEQVRAVLPGAVVTSLREHVRPDGAFALAVLLAATALLMVVAWVQVAALLFSRAAGHAHEVGIRLALGAGRSQLIRQFATEGLVIACTALVIGWLLTPLVTRGVVALLPEGMTTGQLLSPDLRALGFAAGLTLLGVLILALVPIDVVRRGSPLGLLRGSTVGGVRINPARWRTGMLVAQLAVTVVLLYVSGLAAGSASRLAAVDVGFDSARVLAFRQPPLTTSTGGANVTPEERRAHLNRQVQAVSDTYQALRVLPGVAAVAGGRIPFLESRVSGSAEVRSQIRVGAEGQPSETAFLNTTTPDYARVLGLTMVEGRLPSETDVVPGEAVALVNQAFADVLARRGPVLGQQLTANNRTSRVIGVVKNFVVDRPDRPVEPMMLAVLRSPQAFFLVRLEPGERGDQAAVAVGATFERIWPGHPSRNIMAVDDLAEGAIADYRARATMLVLIGVMCLPLALVGITGALNYATELRTREIGIRLALGASPRDIRRAVGKTALMAASLGLGVGLVGGALMGRVMSAYLFGVNAVDPLTIASVAALLAVVGWCASWFPARRASNIQPAVALRHG